MVVPRTRSVLQTLFRARLAELGRGFSVVVPEGATREQQAEALAVSARVRFRNLLGNLGRDELRAACRAHGLEDAGRARPALAARLLQAHGGRKSAPPPPIFAAREALRCAPRPGDIAEVGHRQWFVEEVIAPPARGHATCVRLVCLDDDHQGRALEVLWELELGARVMVPEAHGPIIGVLDNRQAFIDTLPCTPEIRAVLSRAVAWNADGRFAEVAERANALRQAASVRKTR